MQAVKSEAACGESTGSNLTARLYWLSRKSADHTSPEFPHLRRRFPQLETVPEGSWCYYQEQRRCAYKKRVIVEYTWTI